jgi:uncharacterized protein
MWVPLVTYQRDVLDRVGLDAGGFGVADKAVTSGNVVGRGSPLMRRTVEAFELGDRRRCDDAPNNLPGKDLAMAFYSDAQRSIQQQFQSVQLADRLEVAIVSAAIDPIQHQPFIESRDFFFLSTVNAAGEPTVSYKGGGVGVVTVVDPTTLAFPSYDGNGMFLSMGNIAETAKIGMLFIDFETPNRLRVQATATVSSDDPLMEKYPGAQLIVRASLDQVWVNCARMIHPHQRLATSRYVPDADGNAPYPAWKRIDLLQDALAPADMGRAENEGGLISNEDYAAKLMAGDS